MFPLDVLQLEFNRVYEQDNEPTYCLTCVDDDDDCEDDDDDEEDSLFI
jgi:hypothetical protein